MSMPPTSIPDLIPFKGIKDESIQQYLDQVEQESISSNHVVEDDSTTLPVIAGMGMQELAASWYFRWQRDTELAQQTWINFKTDARNYHEPPNYQRQLREEMRMLKQNGDIHTYNGKFKKLCSRIRDMGNEDQICNYTENLDQDVRNYVKMVDVETIDEVMKLAERFISVHGEKSSFENNTKQPRKGKNRLIGKDNQSKKKFKKFQGTCFHCKKVGHKKEECRALKRQNRAS